MLVVDLPEARELPGLGDRLAVSPPWRRPRRSAAAGRAGARTFITLASGAIFGALEGAAYALGAALLAAALGFTVGRLLGAGLRRRAGTRPAGPAGRWFARQSVLGVVTVRLLPIAGFGRSATATAPPAPGAAVPRRQRDRLRATAFGYAAVGATVTSPGDVNWFGAAPAALGLIASVVLIHRWWRAERQRRLGPS